MDTIKLNMVKPTIKINENNTLGVSQIMKDEAHVLPRWFESIYKIVDHVTLVDTGSTDNSIAVAKELGLKYNIPVDVYTRPFDNFRDSRNYAMEMAKGKTTYCFWLDIDEILVVDTNIFDKKKLDKDIYMFTTQINDMDYTRNELWRTDCDFTWYGPIHEYIIPKTPEFSQTLTSGLAEGITVVVKTDGASWNERVDIKYKKHAEILESYINNEDRNPRWVFYTAQSYHDSANIPNNHFENNERRRRAIYYYTERVNDINGYHEERYYSQFRIGTLMMGMNKPWTDCKNALLKAYLLDPLRGEPIRLITEYYQQVGEWHMAYLYSKIGITTYHNNNPYPHRLLFIDKHYYNWRAAELHAYSSAQTGRMQEATKAFNETYNYFIKNMNEFSEEDRFRIQHNAPQFGIKIN